VITVAGLCAAILLLAGAVSSTGRKYRVRNAALAFAAGLAFPGFLESLDLMFGLQGPFSRNEGYSLQEGFAFVTAVAALAIIARRRQGTPSVTAA
jgi:hypothetical protein